MPESEAELTRGQSASLDEAVAGLATGGQVIPVRLALFAEMVKARPWTPATLRGVGGAGSVGVAFLEEAVAAATAPTNRRRHRRATQAVLRALLPEAGTDLKGRVTPRSHLLPASGYAHSPRHFEALIHLLDGELRLVTPTDPEDAGAEGRSSRAGEGEKYYQLTHDYLVVPLREWLSRGQRETARGRAELRLAERAAVWSARPERRHLPTAWEWLRIRLLTRRGTWNTSDRDMMRKATRRHATAGLHVRDRIAERDEASRARRTGAATPGRRHRPGARGRCRVRRVPRLGDPPVERGVRGGGTGLPPAVPCRPGPLARGARPGGPPLRPPARRPAA